MSSRRKNSASSLRSTTTRIVSAKDVESYAADCLGLRIDSVSEPSIKAFDDLVIEAFRCVVDTLTIVLTHEGKKTVTSHHLDMLSELWTAWGCDREDARKKKKKNSSRSRRMGGGGGDDGRESVGSSMRGGGSTGGDYFQASEYYGRDSGRYVEAAVVRPLEHSSFSNPDWVRSALDASDSRFQPLGGASAMFSGGAAAAHDEDEDVPAFLPRDVLSRLMTQRRHDMPVRDTMVFAEEARLRVKKILERAVHHAMLLCSSSHRPLLSKVHSRKKTFDVVARSAHKHLHVSFA